MRYALKIESSQLSSHNHLRLPLLRRGLGRGLNIPTLILLLRIQMIGKAEIDIMMTEILP